MRNSLWLAALLSTTILAGPIQQAETLVEQGRQREAADLLEQTLANETLKPAALLALTRLYNEEGDYAKSVDYGERAVEALPESSEAHLAYAVALKIKLNQISRFKGMLVIGRYKSALRKALELDPKNVDARVEEIGFLIHAPGIIGGSETKAQEKIDDLKSTHRREAMVMQAELRDKQEDARSAQPEMPTGQATPVPPSPQ